MTKLQVETESIDITEEMTKSWYVMFAIPCYDQQITEATFMSIIKTVMFFRDHGIKFAVSTITDSLISRARNNITAKFLANSEFTHMMFIDADIGFEPQDIIKLLWHDKEVMTGAYPIKDINWKKVKHDAVVNDVNYKELMSKSLRFVVNPVRDSEQTTLKVENGAIEIFDAGTGFMLIKRSCFEKLIEAYPNLKYDDDTGSLTGKEKEYTYAFFNSYIDPHRNRFLSEDYGFCRYWQDIKGSIWVDPGITLVHVGRIRYTGSMLTYLQDIDASKK
jgi:hypothetical protein